MYFLVTNEQYDILQIINSNHNTKKILPTKSVNNNWIIKNDLLNDCNNPENTWYDWKEWLLSLEPTDETPKIPPERPKKNNLR